MTTLAMWLSHSQGLCLQCLSDHALNMLTVLCDEDNLDHKPFTHSTNFETALLIGNFVDRLNELEKDTFCPVG